MGLQGKPVLTQSCAQEILAPPRNCPQGKAAVTKCCPQDTHGWPPGNIQGEACAEPQLSPGNARSSQELCDWYESLEQELSQEDSESYWDFSNLEELIEPELSQEKVKHSPAVSDWDECRKQELSQGDL